MQSSVLSNNPAEDIAPISPFGAIDYGVTIDDLAKLTAQYSHITQVTTRKEYDAAQAAVTALTRARTKVENRRKVLKAESLEFGRLVDATAKTLIAVVTPEEARIDALIEAVKRQKEAEKAERERIEKARVDAILADIDAIVKIPAIHQRDNSAQLLAIKSSLEVLLIDDRFAEFKNRAQDAKDNALAELSELYAGALHDERIAANEKAERERQAAEQKAESERLARERAELEEARRLQAAEAAEQKRIADEIAAKERAELDRREAELKAERARLDAEKRAEAERIEEQQRAEAARLEAQRVAEAFALAEAEAADKAKRMAPDLEKLEALAHEIELIQLPELSAEVAKYLPELESILKIAAHDVRQFAKKVRA